jgi:uncharacterized FlaG/YvyC family protein
MKMQINPVMPIASEGIAATLVLPEHRAENHAKVQPKQQSETTATEEQSKALADIAQVIEPFKIALKFSKDDETGRIVVEMIDQDSGETIQQLPTKVSLHVSAVLSKLQGKFVNVKA